MAAFLSFWRNDMVVDIQIVSVQQFISAAPDGRLQNCVGSTHLDGRTEPPYILENLWLRYELLVPCRLKAFSWNAAYRAAYSTPENVKNQLYGWGFGTITAPGIEEYFTWDTGKKTAAASKPMSVPGGTNWFWLTYDYVGQNNGYVDYVELSLSGEAAASVRIVENGSAKGGDPHIFIDGAFKRGRGFVYKNGVWHPGI